MNRLKCFKKNLLTPQNHSLPQHAQNHPFFHPSRKQITMSKMSRLFLKKTILCLLSISNKHLHEMWVTMLRPYSLSISTKSRTKDSGGKVMFGLNRNKCQQSKMSTFHLFLYLNQSRDPSGKQNQPAGLLFQQMEEYYDGAETSPHNCRDKLDFIAIVQNCDKLFVAFLFAPTYSSYFFST